MDEEDTQTGALSQIANQLQDAFDPSTTVEAQDYSRRILARTLDSDYGKNQKELFDELEKNSAEARQVLKDARAKLMARKYNPADAWFALAGALGSPTKFGTMGEMFANAAKELRDPVQKRFEFEQQQDKDALDLQQKEEALQEKLLALKLGQLGVTRKSDIDLAKEALKTLGKRTAANTTPDKGAQAVDRAYAKDYVDWIQNGEPEASQALTELNSSLDQLHGVKRDAQGNAVPLKRRPPLTGPVVGSISTIPFAGKWIQDVLFPTSANTQEQIESTVQRSLRPILGAQFTEKEGERLISRVYNPRLDEQVNAKRIEWLINKLNTAYKNKQEAAAYFRQNNTLKGFTPKHQFSINDFMPDSTTPGEPGYDEQDTEPASSTVDPNQLPPGTKIYKLEDLPHRKHAEGGQIKVPKGSILVQLPDGSITIAPEGSTQEDIAEATTPPAATPTTPASDAAAAAPQEPVPATGTGDEDESSLKRALFGAGVGAATGYPAARTLLRAGTRLGDLFPGRRETPAESRLLRLMEQQGLGASDIATNVRRSQRRGVPAMALDVGPEGFRSIAETALPEGGAQTQDLLNRLTQRQAESRQRASDQINTALKPDDYFTREDELKKRLYGDKANGVQSASDLAYSQAYQQFPNVRSKQLTALMDTPSGSKAVKAAMKTMKDRGIPIGNVNPVTGAVTKYSLQFLNQVKIELDDLINKEEAKGATGRGNTLRGLRDAFRNELDTATTDPQTGVSPYKTAREINQTDRSMLEALQRGRNDFSKMEPQELTKLVGNMSFEQKDAFRSGVAQNLYEMLNKPSGDINAARKLVGSPAMRAKLKTLFDNPNEYKVFAEALTQEMNMYDQSKGLLDQKGVIGRRAVAPQGNVVQRGAQKAPTLGIFSPTQWALRWIRSKPEIKPKDAADAIELLKSQNPDELNKFVKRLGPKVGRAASRVKMRGKAGLLGAGLGALAGALFEGSDAGADEEDPTLAGLDEEGRKQAMTPAKKRGGRVGFAVGGKVGMLAKLIQALKNTHSTTPLEPGPLRQAIHDISDQTQTSPRLVWQMFDQPTVHPPEMAPTRPGETPQPTPQATAALDALKRSIAFEKQRMDRINAAVAGNQSLRDPQVDQVSSASALANDAYNTVMSNPSMENYTRLQQLVRHLADTAGMRRGGSVSWQFGGMTTHA